MLVAHEDRPLAPHELWTSWNVDPLVVAGLLLVAWVYRRGRSHRPDARQELCFYVGLVVLAVALLSPLDPLSRVLASAHMVQHLLLTLVAAPLLALSAPAAPLLRGAPAALRGAALPWRQRLHAGTVTGLLRRPFVVWFLHVGTLWLWHAAVLYGAALDNPLVHAAEHATFLVTGILFWRVVVGPRAVRASPGLGLLLVFGMTLQSALLALLLTFAQTPWYAGYATTTQPWGLGQLADQNLAGAIMWVPAGLVYLGTALLLLVGWLRATEDESDVPTTGAVPAAPARIGQGR